eukprot:m.90760 g.90760  ORF g.90760 m.90760 type:complete len:81 (-) comp14604_c1_seq6:245-487(-)
MKTKTKRMKAEFVVTKLGCVEAVLGIQTHSFDFLCALQLLVPPQLLGCAEGMSAVESDAKKRESTCQPKNIHENDFDWLK